VAASAIAPGARVFIRDAECIVKRVVRTGTGGQTIQVFGVSEIVRHKEARFLSEIEGKSITILDPADPELLPESSPQFRNSRLYLESLLHRSPLQGIALVDLWQVVLRPLDAPAKLGLAHCRERAMLIAAQIR
jgi:hypothetical protein